MTTLEDVCDAIIDCEHKTAPEDSAGLAVAVGTPHVRQGRLNLRSARRISEETYESWTRRGVPEAGDIVLTREAPVGDVGMVPDGWRIALGQRTVLLRPSTDRVEPQYLLYLLQGRDVQRWMLDRSSGSTVAHLNVADVRDIELPDLPTLPYQARVAGILGVLDSKIDLNQRIANGAEELAARELGALAETAAWVELGEIAEHHKVSVDPRSLDAEVDHFSLPAFDAGRRPVREVASAIKSNKLEVPDRAVLVSRLNPRIPRVWFVRTTLGVPAMCSTEFLVLRPKADISEGELFAACSHPDVLSDMARRAGGTSGSHQRIKPADALSVAVPNPDSDVLRAALTPLLEAAAQARAESVTLAEFRDALLPKLLSGEIRVREAEEELEEAGV